MNTHRIFTSACDAIFRFRISLHPLKNVVLDIILERNLNSRERKALFTAVFDFIREIHLFDRFLSETVRFAKSLSTQQKDLLFFKILFSELLFDAQIKETKERYNAWLLLLGDKHYLLALGPFIMDELINDYGVHAPSVAQGLLRTPKKYATFDKRLVSAEEISKELTILGIEHFFHPVLSRVIGFSAPVDLEKLPKHIAHALWFMDAGSAIIAELVKPKPHEYVLDICAGEGNKARYITSDDCHYLAADVDASRLAIAQNRLPKNVQCRVLDGRKSNLCADSFDFILLDAPCSGVGTFRREPDLSFRLDKSKLLHYVQLQQDLLRQAVHLLKPGGKLIYATCSLFHAENEQQISRVISENDQIKPLALRALVVDTELHLDNDALDKNSFTIFPHIIDCDGFYFAALTKQHK